MELSPLRGDEDGAPSVVSHRALPGLRRADGRLVALLSALLVDLVSPAALVFPVTLTGGFTVFHLAVFSQSQGIGAVNDQLNAVLDQGITLTQNNNYVFSQEVEIRLAYALGTGISRTRINAPSLRRLFLPSIQPLDTATAPPDLPAIADLRNAGLTIPRMDEVGIETTNTDAGAQQHTVGLWIGDGQYNSTPGPIFTARFTAAITSVAFAWVIGAITLEQGLPAGVYTVVGFSCWVTSLLFARLQFPTQVWRPGVVGRTAEGNDERFLFRMGGMGDFGTFVNIALPQLEIFCNAAAAITPAGYLDLVKVG